MEGLCGRVILHIFAFANRSMAGRIAVGQMSCFIHQKVCATNALTAVWAGVADASCAVFAVQAYEADEQKDKVYV